MQFGTVAIIGLGLIGSSLSRSLIDKNLAHVIGCSRTRETVDTALKLGAINEGTTDLTEACRNADIIVLCTPLGAYKSITKTIAPHMKNGAILTDAGSVKNLPSQEILAELSELQKSLFVPGHPIAGTEKSGPEAGFKGLYEGKKTLLTPFSCTEESSINTVTKMWNLVGAEVEIMDAERHDFIYAMVSHLVQFLSSTFGLLAGKYEHDIAPHIDDNYRDFIRLTGSDTAMWRDIFLFNKQNLAKGLSIFLEHLSYLETAINSDEKNIVQKNIERAQKKREHFQKTRSTAPHSHSASDYCRADKNTKIIMHYMPRLLSCALMECIAESEYEHATNAGLHGFTRNLIINDGLNSQQLLENKDILLEITHDFKHCSENLLNTIKNSDKKGLETLLCKAKKHYIMVNNA